MILRPVVAMQQYVGVPYVVALGVCDAVSDAGISWPYDVVNATSHELVCRVEAHAGYDDEGLFVRVGPEDYVGQEFVRVAVERRVCQWAERLAGKPRMAPLAPVLADYSAQVVGFGHEVLVTYPNGNPYARGVFRGLDIWGRATVRLEAGEEIEFPPEQYRIV